MPILHFFASLFFHFYSWSIFRSYFIFSTCAQILNTRANGMFLISSIFPMANNGLLSSFVAQSLQSPFSPPQYIKSKNNTVDCTELDSVSKEELRKVSLAVFTIFFSLQLASSSFEKFLKLFLTAFLMQNHIPFGSPLYRNAMGSQVEEFLLTIAAIGSKIKKRDFFDLYNCTSTQ